MENGNLPVTVGLQGGSRELMGWKVLGIGLPENVFDGSESCCCCFLGLDGRVWVQGKEGFACSLLVIGKMWFLGSR